MRKSLKMFLVLGLAQVYFAHASAISDMERYAKLGEKYYESASYNRAIKAYLNAFYIAKSIKDFKDARKFIDRAMQIAAGPSGTWCTDGSCLKYEKLEYELDKEILSNSNPHSPDYRKDQEHLINDILNIGTDYASRKYYTKAMYYIKYGINKAKTINDKGDLEIGYYYLGDLYKSMGDYKNALINLEKAKVFAEKLKDKDLLQSIEYDIESVRHKLGR